MIFESIAIALLVWLFIGACALPFTAKVFESYREDQEDDQV